MGQIILMIALAFPTLVILYGLAVNEHTYAKGYVAGYFKGSDQADLAKCHITRLSQVNGGKGIGKVTFLVTIPNSPEHNEKLILDEIERLKAEVDG